MACDRPSTPPNGPSASGANAAAPVRPTANSDSVSSKASQPSTSSALQRPLPARKIDHHRRWNGGDSRSGAMMLPAAASIATPIAARAGWRVDAVAPGPADSMCTTLVIVSRVSCGAQLSLAEVRGQGMPRGQYGPVRALILAVAAWALLWPLDRTERADTARMIADAIKVKIIGSAAYAGTGRRLEWKVRRHRVSPIFGSWSQRVRTERV